MKASFLSLLVILFASPTEGLLFEIICRILSPLLPFLFPNGCVPCSLDDMNVECCSTSDCEDPNSDVCESRYCIGRGNPRFTLTWSGDDDYDIHVITPGGIEIYFDNLYDPVSGGELDLDSVPPEEDVKGRYVENIFFPLDGSAPRGTYTFFVSNFLQYNSPDSYKIQVYVGDTLSATQTGSLEEDQDGMRYTFVF